MVLYTATKSVLIIIALVVITACGFKLRGDDSALSVEGESFLLTAPNPLYDLRIVLERTLVGSGATTNISSSNRINLISEQIDKRALTRDSTGRPTELEVRLTVYYQFTEGDRFRLRLTRHYLYNRIQPLTAEQREQELLQAMREELSRQILLHWVRR